VKGVSITLPIEMLSAPMFRKSLLALMRGGRVGRFAAPVYRIEVVTEADEQGRSVERGVQVVDERAKRVLAAVAEAMSCGCGMSLRRIAARLAAQGLVRRAGKPYTAAAIRSMRDRIAQQSKVAA